MLKYQLFPYIISKHEKRSFQIYCFLHVSQYNWSCTMFIHNKWSNKSYFLDLFQVYGELFLHKIIPIHEIDPSILIFYWWSVWCVHNINNKDMSKNPQFSTINKINIVDKLALICIIKLTMKYASSSSIKEKPSTTFYILRQN